MPGRVQYIDESGKSVLALQNPEGAIEAACSLIDRGHRVLCIGTADPDDTISEIEIARIYAIWARAKKPFG
jgi:DNA-binding LacI/PurR family transcriptional regulator